MPLPRKYNFLVADDELPIVKIVSDILAINPHTSAIFTASDGERALSVYQNNRIDIVITDILMPRLSGMDLVKKMREINPNAHIIIVSAYNNIDLVREALRNGAYDYILKPFSVDEIMFSVNRVIDHLKLLEEKDNYVISLEKKIQETTSSLQDAFFDTLKTIMNTLEIRDINTLKHCNLTAEYAVKLAEKLKLNEKTVENIRVGSLIHDIGKIGVPDFILTKLGPLSEEEMKVVQKHCVSGHDIVQPILNKNKDIIDIVLMHHERMDGKGYPDGIYGKSIPITARIVNLANSYAAMISESVYRKPLTLDEAILEIRANSGTQFDAEISSVFVSEILLKEKGL